MGYVMEQKQFLSNLKKKIFIFEWKTTNSQCPNWANGDECCKNPAYMLGTRVVPLAGPKGSGVHPLPL